VEIIAHRGASYEAPENTLASVNLGWQQRADAVEVDVHLSKDAEIVVIHDAVTSKVAGVRKRVSDQTLGELKRLDVGRWKGDKWAGETIATLGEVLVTVPAGKRLFVEIKCGSECIPAFQKAVRGVPEKSHQIVVIGFGLETMQRIKQTLPEIEVCWIAEFKRNWKTGQWSPKPALLIEKVVAAGLDGLDLGARGPITRALVQQVKEAKLKLYVWTVDLPGKARRLIEAGVDGITTNRPGWLREELGL